MIYILSAPVQTGKTTSLMNLVENRKDFGGFLSPTIDGQRKLLNLQTGEHIDFEVTETYTAKLSVGRFHFSQAAFANASSWTREHIALKIKNIIIDEIGKLENNEKGFFNLADELIKLDRADQNLLLVVRDYLLDEITTKFKIENAKVISVDLLSHTFPI